MIIIKPSLEGDMAEYSNGQPFCFDKMSGVRIAPLLIGGETRVKVIKLPH